MSFQLKKASRHNVKLRVGMFGPSGSGKTMSALRFAKGLVDDWSRIAVLDTENSSAELYSHLGDYLHCPFEAPFDPRRYVEAINYIKSAAKIDCLIIDSISHEWEGAGGCLELHTKAGGRFQDWAKITPLHKAFIDTILQAPFHVITTGRSKVDYALDKDQNNRTQVKKMGLKTVTREGFDYEMTLAFQINIDHLAIADKDRTDLFNTQIPFEITEEVGRRVRDWNDSGQVNYKEQFQKLGREYCGTSVELWDLVKNRLGYDKENTENEYWKEMCDRLKEMRQELN